MTLNLVDLAKARPFMPEEVNIDISQNTLYISPRLSKIGVNDYPNLLRDAASTHNAEWLACELSKNNRLNAQEQQTRQGKVITKAVPINANTTLAEGEFNRFYIRALCIYAIQNNIQFLVVYRARESLNPRPESLDP